ncbi:MAG: hypothetical protein K2N95_13965 [Lachnospiraceae bacterium]|nr:hypothetical protein [Lachnospiraceae bacterium]
MKQLAYVLEKIFGVIFLVFAAGLVVCSFHGGSGFEHNVLWYISRIIVILFFTGAVYCALNLPKCITGKEGYRNIVSIFVISLCVHLLVVWVVGAYTEQVSDFGFAFAFSEKSFPLAEAPDQYRIMSNWAIYPLYLKFIQELFGYGDLTGVICNAVLCAFSSALIYVLCYMGLNNENIGYLAALIYTFWPSHLLYSVVLSPEFVNIFLTLLFLLLIETVIRKYKEKTACIMICLSAVVLSLSGFFKRTDKIILVALSIMLVLFVIKTACLQSLKKGMIGGGGKVCKKLLVLLFICIYLLSNKLIFAGLDYAYGEAVNRDPTMHFIYVGLNPQTYGTWNKESGGIYTQNVQNCDYDYKKASKLTLEQLKEEIKEKKYLTPVYFERKFEVAWENNGETYWVNETISDASPILKKPNWFYAVNTLTQNFWMMTCIFVCMEAAFLLFRSDSRRMFSCLFLFGFACLMFLSEVQERYKCVMYPIISILAADGIVHFVGVLNLIFGKGKQYICSVSEVFK